jgi:hypothetical protein
MMSAMSAELHPQVVAGFDHVAFIDPPFDQSQHAAIIAAAGAEAWLHFVWGAGEVHFSESVLAADYDLDRLLRRVWRALSGAGAGSRDELERKLLQASGRPLAKLPALAAALRTLREAGLVAGGCGKNVVTSWQGKADLDRSEAYRTWRRRFQASDYLSRCLTAAI